MAFAPITSLVSKSLEKGMEKGLPVIVPGIKYLKTAKKNHPI